ncbi:hypothetical protein ACIHEI_17015 [Kitasatospora sp. NPDC051984]|uniref:hypothetical protein n=1 Tax=Kitasatospora sp. NPDC051984 TaxID=3364059 RepID=UPI0037C51E82
MVDRPGLDRSPDPPAALRTVPAEHLLAAYRQLVRDVSPPGQHRSADVPRPRRLRRAGDLQQALADGRLDGKQLLTGTKDEMTAFFTFAPFIRSAIAEQARSIAAALLEGGAGRFAATGRPAADRWHP